MNLRAAGRLCATVLAVVVSCWSAATLSAAPQEPRPEPSANQRIGETFEVAPAATETVADIMERQRLLPPYAIRITIKEELPSGHPKRPNPDAPAVSSWPPREDAALVVPDLLRPADPLLPQSVGVNFNAITLGVAESQFIPPDSMGDVGPTQVLVVSNGRIKVFDKTGVLGALNVSTDAFFQSVRVGGTSDPHIRYDRLAQRWFVVMIDVGACGNQVLMAVSSGPTITGTASFTFFSFVGEPNGTNPHFTDYPTLGVDRNALYIGGNMFDVTQVGCATPFDPVNVTVWVVNKASLISGGPATVTAFRGLVNNTTSVGTWTAQGVDNDDPQATEGFFLGVDFFAFSRLNFFRVTNPGGVPTLSAQMNITVPTTVLPQAQPQPAAGPTLDALDDRLFAAAVHRNKITGQLSLWSAHNIEVDATGVANAAGNRNGSRWYQIINLAGTPGLTQSGTLFDSSATPFGYWIPSIMMSGQGHAAIASSRASTVNPTGFASIAAAGRLRTDAPGSTQAPTLVQQSASAYNQAGGPPERWGDYSQTVVDPNDDQTMWTFQEWASAVNTWGVNVTQLRAPPPVTPTTANPATVSQGQPSILVNITGPSVVGSEFFDPGPDSGGPGFANRISAAVSGGVTVNSVTFSAPTGVTLNISTVGTPTGAKDVTVTNPDGQARTGIGILTVIGCPPITVNPAFVPGGTVGSPYSQTFTQTGGTLPVTFGLAGTLPTGVTFNVGTATLSGTPTQIGSFNFTVSVTDADGCTGSRDYTLAVGCQAITVSPATIPNGTAGSPYSQTFTQTGGLGTITWQITGTLPTGLTLNASTGVLSGTPTQTGSFPITITARDANNCGGSRGYTLVINCQTISVNPPAIPNGTAGSPYSQTFTQTSGIGTVTWSVTGTLPTGITLNPSTGVLSGTPTQVGSFPITVNATDSNLCIGSRAYTLVIGCQTITVNPATIPNGTAGSPYSQTFTQTSGIGTVTWSVTGTLPTGITLNTSTGVLSGTPAQTGSFPITVRATDANGCIGSRSYTLVIGCQTITVNPATIPAGTAGSPYSQTFTQTSGIGTITWSVTGALPTGITLNTSTGVLSGTPTQLGGFPITITASDSNACTGNRGYTLVVNAAGPFVPIALNVDEAGNRVLEAGETAVVAPSWRNDTGAPQPLTGAATLFTGPGTSTYTITDAAANYGATVAAGGTANCSSATGDCYGFNITVPNPRPATHWDSTFRETLSSADTKNWTLHVGDSFADVPRANGFYRFIETLLHKQITGGCSGTTYCPGSSTLREQMAVFVLIAKEGPGYQPAACTTPIFNDVPATNPFCRFIEELSRRGVVSGCGGGNYCPLAAVTREQMSVFVLRTLDPTLNPPACTTPVFADVPASSPFCRWIEELARRGVVTGCGGGNYCPGSPVTREQMGVFITVTFGLTLYGP